MSAVGSSKQQGYRSGNAILLRSAATAGPERVIPLRQLRPPLRQLRPPLLQIKGVGLRKLQELGPRFLAGIREYGAGAAGDTSPVP